MSTRASTSDAWGPRVAFSAPINSPQLEANPSLSSDTLEFIFTSSRSGGLGKQDLYSSSRADRDSSWETVTPLRGEVNSPYGESNAELSNDGLLLLYSSDRPGGLGSHDLWMSTRKTETSDWGAAVHLGSTVNSSAKDLEPAISSDRRVLMFQSDRPGTLGKHDLWMSIWSESTKNWTTPVNCGPPLNSQYEDRGPAFSVDGRMLIFHSDRPGTLGGEDLWMSRRVRKQPPRESTRTADVSRQPVIKPGDGRIDMPAFLDVDRDATTGTLRTARNVDQ